MAKYGNTNFVQLSRGIFNGRGEGISYHGKWLYTVLTELEHRFSGNKTTFFYRSNEDLAIDSGMSVSTVKRRKTELVKKGLIQTWQTHWQNSETEKLSEKHVTAYRILR